MQGLQPTRAELSSALRSARRMAHRYGSIGIVEPDDIVQESMIKLLNKNDGKPANKAWLHKVVHTTVLDAGRAHVRECQFISRDSELDSDGSVSVLTQQNERLYIAPTAGIREDDDDIDPEVVAHLTNMLKTLKTPLRHALLLCAQGATYEEIARLTGAKVGTVRSRIHYARIYAREFLRDLIPDSIRAAQAAL